MATKKKTGLSRRQFVKAAATATGVAVSGVGATLVGTGCSDSGKKGAEGSGGAKAPAAAARKKLTIIQWNHFVPGYDKWFKEKWIKEWGEKNNTDVTVDTVDLKLLPSRLAAEASAKKGHDLFMSLQPVPVYEELVIDHKEIYDECEKAVGKPLELAVKSTFNPKTKRYHGFSDGFVPDPINYRTDLWDEVGVKPDSWDAILDGGRKIMKAKKIPVGIGMANELDTAMAIRSMMYSNGAHEQDADGNLVLKSKEMLDVLKYAKALYTEAMTPEVLSWDPSSNNRAMLAGKISLALNAISITRTGENQKNAIHEKIGLGKAAQGKVRRIGLEHLMSIYTIWQFAENIDGAKKFLVDLVTNYTDAFKASEFYNFPCFPGSVPKLKESVANDPKAAPNDKYAVLTDVNEWATNIGYPGYANAAIGEAWDTWVLNTMFAKVVSGKASAEDALNEAHAQYEKIYAKWKEKKLI